ncbi:MAG: proteasome accessory factor PafA2 family protein, partial [Dehalococcoidia bacterium]
HSYHHFASFDRVVSLPVLCGSGRCSSEEGENLFQIWQRGDFLRSRVGLQTTYDRPLVNSRDEALAADPDRYARFHVIAFDANRMEFAEYLKLGLLRLLCAAIDADRIDTALELDDPIAAIRSISRRFSIPLRLARGKTATALEIQREFLAAFVRLHEQDSFAERVPDAAEILARWDETLACLEKDAFSLIGSLDWITKYAWLEQIRSNENLNWSSPQMKWFDIQYHCLTGSDAPTFPCTRITTDEQIDALALRPPRLSRAAIRGELLRRFGDEIAEANWHWLASSDRKTAYLLPDDPTPDIVQVPDAAKTLKEAAASLGLAAVQLDSREHVSAYADEIPRKEPESMAVQP